MTAISALPGSGFDAKATLSSRQPVNSQDGQQESAMLRLARLCGREGKKLDPVALPEDLFSAYMTLQKDRQEVIQSHLRLQSIPETASAPESPRTAAYAKIVVGGKVVATIDNQGVVGTENGALGDRINKLIMDGLDAESNLPSGPSIAQDRAERIAKLVGGKIVKADTALTQSGFDALPSPAFTRTVDYEGMKSDPLYSQLQNWRTTYEAIQSRRNAYLAENNGAIA